MTDDRYGKIHTDGSRSGGQPVFITKKAHTMVLEVLAEWGLEPRSATPRQLAVATTEALCRAIEQHEAFKQEVSDVVAKAIVFCKDGHPASAAGAIGAFVIPKPKSKSKSDALVEALVATDDLDYEPQAEAIHAALDALGFEIREKG